MTIKKLDNEHWRAVDSIKTLLMLETISFEVMLVQRSADGEGEQNKQKQTTK